MKWLAKWGISAMGVNHENEDSSSVGGGSGSSGLQRARK
jgi:hypothetical protein